MADLVDGAPLTFVVRAPDGKLLDVMVEDELATWAGESGKGKSWNEAVLWAHLATVQDRRERPDVYKPKENRCQA